MRVTLVAVAALLCLSVAAADNSYTWSDTPGKLTVSNLTMSTNGVPYGPGVYTVVKFNGVCNSSISTGAFKYQTYETGMPHFGQSGSYPYFKCTNKACNPDMPLSLALTNPTEVPTTYTGQVALTMPRKYATGEYTLLLWGEDQTHSQDVSISIKFAYQ